MSLRIECEPRLIEEAVFLALREPDAISPKEAAAHRHDLDRLYALPPGASRESAFAESYLAMFERLGLRARIDAVLRLFTRLSYGVDRLVFSHSARMRDQDSELFRNSANLVTVLLRLCPQTLVSSADFERFAIHELFYSSDMLDPAFGYSPRLVAPELAPQQLDMLRDRYRALWDICIDGRIERMKKPPRQPRERRLVEFLRLFGASAQMNSVFNRLWSGSFDGKMNHPALTAAAQHPAAMGQLAGVAIPDAGAACHFARQCPLCRCSTHQWTPDPQRLPTGVVARIQRTFAEWTPEQGMCGQCADIFQSECVAVHS